MTWDIFSNRVYGYRARGAKLDWVDWVLLKGYIKEGLKDLGLEKTYDTMVKYISGLNSCTEGVSLYNHLEDGLNIPFRDLPRFLGEDILIQGVIRYRLSEGR